MWEEGKGARCSGQWAGVLHCPHGEVVAHERPILQYLAADIVPRHSMRAPSQSCTASATKGPRRSFRYRRAANPTFLSSLSPPGPSVVTSPRAPRQFLECLGMLSCGRPGRSFQNRPARTPPSPPPMSLSPFRLQASPIHAGLFFSSVRLSPLPTRHFPIASSLISPVSVSAQLQLSSAREQHTHTLSLTHSLARARTRASAAYSYCGRHGTAGQAGIIYS